MYILLPKDCKYLLGNYLDIIYSNLKLSLDINAIWEAMQDSLNQYRIQNSISSRDPPKVNWNNYQSQKEMKMIYHPCFGQMAWDGTSQCCLIPFLVTQTGTGRDSYKLNIFKNVNGTK